MNCCENCFIPLVIKSVIQSVNKKGNCDFCNSRDVYVYDLENDTGLDLKFNGIMGVFRKKEDLPLEYPSDKLTLIKDELFNNSNIFHKDFPSSRVASFLENLLKNNYPDKVELLDKTVGVLEYINNDYLNENGLLKGYTWDDFITYIKYRNRFHSRHINFDVLKEYLEGMVLLIEKGEIFYRARISNIEELTPDKMGAPPKEYAKAGRANSEGISHLYLATDIETVIKEIRPKTGDNIFVGRFKLSRDIKVIDFKRLKKISIFDFEDDPAKYIINYENFKRLSDEISKPIRTGDSKLDYLPTQFLVDYIKALNDFELRDTDTPYLGIAFESTLSTTGYNLMIFDSDILSCIRISKTKIKAVSYDHEVFYE
ncbi:MAG TPA: RES family NAD+ phosphorylase [Bacillus sp. (in: firmicutes)]|nr:RES family NAD+ phosphorylase [Bacillus sp. (in: firmicutes)]